MTISEYRDALRSAWWALPIAALVGMIVGGLGAALLPPSYHANAVIYFSARATSDQGGFSAYDGAQLAQQRLKLGEGLLRTGRLAESVVGDLRLTATPQQVADALTVTADVDSGLLVIEATDPSPTRAAALANSAARQVEQLAAELDPPTAGNPVTVTPRIVEIAKPQGESSPLRRVLLYLTAGALTGLLLAAGVILLRAALAPRVRSSEALAATARTKVLGTLGRDQKSGEAPMNLLPVDETPLAEGFRKLRAGLGPVGDGVVREIVLITSLAQGASGSDVAANLGLAFARAGARVAIVEADLRSPRLASAFRIAPGPGTAELLQGTSKLDEVVQSPVPGLAVVVAGAPEFDAGDLVGARELTDLVTQLRGQYDLVLIDAPPVLEVADALTLAQQADGVLLVCPFGSKQADVKRAVAELAAVPASVLGTVMTQVPGRFMDRLLSRSPQHR